MKKTYIAILTAAAGLCSCIEMMDSASQADVVNPLNVSFKVKAVTGFVDADGNGTINTDFPVDGLTVRFTNFEEDAVIETLTDENGIAQTEVAPGNYTISVFGESESEGNTYYLNGSVQNKAITKDITPEQAEASNDFSIAIRPAMVGPLCFSQIFYCGSTNPELFPRPVLRNLQQRRRDLLPRPPLFRASRARIRNGDAPRMARRGRTEQLRLCRDGLAAAG